MISENKVAAIHFTLTNDEGEQLETTVGEEPFEYLHGAMEILPALETMLEGKNAGDKFTVTIGAEDAYGEYDEDLVEEVDASEFEGFDEELYEGMEIEMETDEGELPVVITKIDGDVITVDMNHPLAGMDLTFTGEVVSVREATEEELEHGHAGTCDHEH